MEFLEHLLRYFTKNVDLTLLHLFSDVEVGGARHVWLRVFWSWWSEANFSKVECCKTPF